MEYFKMVGEVSQPLLMFQFVSLRQWTFLKFAILYLYFFHITEVTLSAPDDSHL